MPAYPKIVRDPGRRPSRIRDTKPRRTPHAHRKLGPSLHLIAPPHTLILPSLEDIKDRIAVSHGFGAALPLAEALIRRGLLNGVHPKSETRD